MESDSKNFSNSRYQDIIKEIIEPHLQPKLLEWCNTITETHKKVSFNQILN